MKKFIRKSQGSQKIPGVPPESKGFTVYQEIFHYSGTKGRRNEPGSFEM